MFERVCDSIRICVCGYVMPIQMFDFSWSNINNIDNMETMYTVIVAKKRNQFPDSIPRAIIVISIDHKALLIIIIVIINITNQMKYNDKSF